MIYKDFTVLTACSHVAMLECHWLFISPSPAGADISSNAPFTMDQCSPSHTALQTRERVCWHTDQTGHPNAVKWDFPARSVDLFHRSTVSTPRSPLIEKVKEHKWDWSRPQKHSWNITDDAPFTGVGQLIAGHTGLKNQFAGFLLVYKCQRQRIVDAWKHKHWLAISDMILCLLFLDLSILL